jgi:hypothetical protein
VPPALGEIVGQSLTRWLGDGRTDQTDEAVPWQHWREMRELGRAMIDGFAATGLLVQQAVYSYQEPITTARFAPTPQQPDLPAARPGPAGPVPTAAPPAEPERFRPTLFPWQGRGSETTEVAAPAAARDANPGDAAERMLDYLQTALPSPDEVGVWVVPAAAALPLQAGLAFDLQELKREMEAFFARLTVLGEGGPYTWATVRFAVGTAVLAVATFECIRRTQGCRSARQASDSGPGFEPATLLMDVS